MPELPEVETVRAGLATHITGNAFTSIDVLNSRSIRQHLGGHKDFEKQLVGMSIRCVSRRGKFLWMPLLESGDETDRALVMHLGMSGQALLVPRMSADETQLRVKFGLDREDIELRFVDQRMFGGVHVDHLVQVDEEALPQSALHIARDALDPRLDIDAVIAKYRKRSAGVKSLLLNQELMSGVGNIYADEALWLSKIHYATPGERLSAKQWRELIGHVQAVMREAVKAGGTSFDDLYVSVNGESGWFEVSLNAYGQENEPCGRCGRPIVREAWSNRSSFRCPSCQRRPRSAQ
jgi:formamidopyrimidine-DNA glycosylase